MAVIASHASTFGEVLRRYRVAAALSQETLAERAGISCDAIKALERGRRMAPRLQTRLLLAEALELDPADRATLIASGTGSSQAEASGSSCVAPYSTRPAVPHPATPLIGREREVAAVRHMLETGTRLLTLVGTGGVGKTRLALAIVADMQQVYADGVMYVDLSAVRDPELVLVTIAQVIGTARREDQMPLDVLTEALYKRHNLLVLDNFEQVVEAGPQVASLLAACPHLVLLITSRVALRIRAEQRVRVSPLATPRLVRGSPWEDCAASPSVRLFAARAQAVQPAFQLDATNVMDVAEICRRLDGLPLAIELAAAWMVLLSPSAIRSRLEQSVTVLGRGARDLPARQQTLRATLDWSYALLSAPQQTLFRRMAVFAGGATLEAIEAVCCHDGEDTLDVLTELDALVEHNVVRQEPMTDMATGASAPGSSWEEPRIGMLETIREYAFEQLATSGELDDMRQRHASYYMALAETAEPSTERHGSETARAYLEREHGNLRAALAWTLESGEDTRHMQPGTPLWRYWHLHGHQSEARAWMERLLASNDRVKPDVADVLPRATALAAAAWAAQSQGDFPRARDLLEESLALHRALGQVTGLTDLLINGSLMATIQGDHRRAQELLEESLMLQRRAGNRGSIGEGGLGLSLLRLGLVCRNRGDYDQATALYEECLTLHQDLRDREGIALALLGLGDVARDQGEAEQARDYCGQCLALFEELDVAWGRGFALNNLALAALDLGEREQALAHAEESVSVFRGLGESMSLAEALTTLGRILLATGEVTRVAHILNEALRLAWSSGPLWCVAAALDDIAALAIARNQAQGASQFLGAAASLRVVMDTPLPPYLRADWTQSMTAAQTMLSHACFEEAWSAGQRLPLDHVVTAALAFTQ